jgi:hypothetical protein
MGRSRRAYDALMRAGRDTFVDGSDSAPPTVEFPEVVDAFESVGFTRLGRLGRAASGEVWRWAATYPRDRRDEFAAHLTVPPVVLRAPDGSAFAGVGWWWGMPNVQLRTTLDDGSVVETLRRWDRAPVPPRAHGRIYRSGDLQQEQLLLHNPVGGRDVALADGPPADLWAAHQEHVARVADHRRATPVAHSSMAEAVALANRLARHQRACQQAQKRFGQIVLLAIVLVAVAVVVAITSLSPIGLLLLLVAELAAIGLVLALRRRIYAWSLRRRYRPSGRPALEGWTRPR